MCPIFGRGKLTWKGTAKSAAFNLCIDPIDLSGSIPGWCSFYANDRDYHVERVALAAVKAARLDWSKITALGDFAHIFEQRAKMKFKRFSLENYVQTDLAWGLILIALGRLNEGQHRLDAFCQQFAIAPGSTILANAKDEATKMAAGRPAPLFG
ncbi:hypothetical protein EOA60_27970 [Mesorhizobium sp. M1A.F.Ca.IN.020.06.1.1]|uniref:hypothetical protein n=1 Tax=unclassified Mesorhizobium TaxID=325217 RepID=UPI000FCAF9D6|nr:MULTISPECIES: hypothetical protein [unclassified Mesorhizobium]RUV07296.1 hypothetical protein EOA79_05370 [Mesorhizobium sp. M1A.F.Ca.IN.020.03.2.1]RUV89493.1 hypothetical protein EOA51_03765 [Mesorhizobium sp. M1A.F.Ca.IN.020.32.1.1]RUW11434.1 hypothetical protein EOA46_12355 [Mesorhizobium sp. M1A.F.Ca.IN.022.05.2.1]RUW18989.1 hypothetical protein EOA60_27970 [Mesorhizobium sp. M1A.F.Ca.IN.020.06.1.1]RWF79195.1 MAG: hypothetical protein EOQ35_21310 [Mesorhizobium sp.]